MNGQHEPQGEEQNPQPVTIHNDINMPKDRLELWITSIGVFVCAVIAAWGAIHSANIQSATQKQVANSQQETQRQITNLQGETQRQIANLQRTTERELGIAVAVLGSTTSLEVSNRDIHIRTRELEYKIFHERHEELNGRVAEIEKVLDETEKIQSRSYDALQDVLARALQMKTVRDYSMYLAGFGLWYKTTYTNLTDYVALHVNLVDETSRSQYMKFCERELNETKSMEAFINKLQAELSPLSEAPSPQRDAKLQEIGDRLAKRKARGENVSEAIAILFMTKFKREKEVQTFVRQFDDRQSSETAFSP